MCVCTRTHTHRDIQNNGKGGGEKRKKENHDVYTSLSGNFIRYFLIWKHYFTFYFKVHNSYLTWEIVKYCSDI